MANLTNVGSGNFTSAATWAVLDTTSFLDTQVSTNTTTTSFVSSAAFTPGAITIDGIGIQFSTRSTTTGGTVSVRLAIAGVAVTGTTVTVNVTDIDQQPNGWVFFKFAANVTLLPLTAYTVQMQSSVSAGASIFRSATAGDWSRFLRTTTTQAPVAGDQMFVLGEHVSAGVTNTLTVTCDNTAATIFGQLRVGEKGIFQSATAASTAYKFITNSDILMTADSITRIGTLATPIPATSSFTLQINQGGVNVARGIIQTVRSTFSTYGNSITSRVFLNADAAAAATSLTTAVSTGWKTGDMIGIASTTRTAAETETRNLSVDASGTTLTVPAIGFAHSGTGATKAEIINLTRNVIITSDTSSFGTFIVTAGLCTTDFNNTEFRYMGSGTASKRGIDVNQTTGSFSAKGCAFHDFQASSFGLLVNQITSSNVVLYDLVMYNMPGTGILLSASTDTGVSLSDSWFLKTDCQFTLQGGSVSNCNWAGGTTACTINPIAATTVSFSNLVVHSSSAAGISLASSAVNPITFTNLTAWRNNTRGIILTSAHNMTISGVTAFGNVTCGMEINQSTMITINNAVMDGGTTLVQPLGIRFSNSFGILVNNSTFAATTVHTTSDIAAFAPDGANSEILFRNCLFGSTTEISSQNVLGTNSFVGSSKHDQTNGVHKMWDRYGTITYDNVINFTPTSSLRAAPSSATYKLTLPLRRFAIPSGKTAKVSVAIRRSVAGDGTAYNGNLPRLILKSNNSAGISTETVLATASGTSLGSFETISGTTPAVTADTTLEVYVDCDGTTGWINEDNFKVQIINGGAMGTNVNSEDYWQDGRPFQGINTLLTNNSGSETYWIDGMPSPELYPVSAAETGKYWLLFD